MSVVLRLPTPVIFGEDIELSTIGKVASDGQMALMENLEQTGFFPIPVSTNEVKRIQLW